MEAGSPYGPFCQCASLQTPDIGLARALDLLRPRQVLNPRLSRLHLLGQGERPLRVRFG